MLQFVNKKGVYLCKSVSTSCSLGKERKDASEVTEEISTFILPGLSGDRRGDR